MLDLEFLFLQWLDFGKSSAHTLEKNEALGYFIFIALRLDFFSQIN
jgi:hypothetical protein